MCQPRLRNSGALPFCSQAHVDHPTPISEEVTAQSSAPPVLDPQIIFVLFLCLQLD